MYHYPAAKCPDGTILLSRARHDFVCIILDNEHYGIDGGAGGDYMRYIGNVEPIYISIPYSRADLLNDFESGADKLCKFDTAEIILAEEYKPNRDLVWGSRGKDGMEPVTWFMLSDLTKSHLRAILKLDYINEEYRREINKLLKND